MTHRIIWKAPARDDLLSLYDWIADQAGSAIALEFTSKIEASVQSLSDFPGRGTPRDDLLTGLRTVTYRRRTVIAYRIVGNRLEILRVSHGGRDLAGLFAAGEG